MSRFLGSCTKVLGFNQAAEDARELARLQNLVDNGILLPMIGNTHGFEEVYFFQVDMTLDGEAAVKKYSSLGLEPVDWESLAWINENDHSLAESHPNGTQWQNNGRWRYLAFSMVRDGYAVQTGPLYRWLPGSWLAGRPFKWTTY